MKNGELSITHPTVKTFKAGDFTSGKMGEIFKTCHHSLDLATISHKQFGDANLIPVEFIEFIATRGLSRNCLFNQFLDSERSMSIDDFMSFKSETKFEIVNDFLCDGFTSWFDMMTGLFLVWSDSCHDQDREDTKADL